jgi:hypothetical protein
VLICALATSLLVAVTATNAVEPRGGEIVETSWPGFPEIASPASPEGYEYQLNLGPGQVARQVNEHEVVVAYADDGTVAFTLHVEEAHAADGATVPTSLRLVEGDELITTVHHHEGNPAVGGAPFVYPILDGPGWEGGFRTFPVQIQGPPDETELAEQRAREAAAAEAPETTPAAPAPPCKVPSLRGFSLHAAEARLAAEDCAVGKVHLATGATAAKGRVVKQFRAAGIELAAGAPVALKLGALRR